ncbi:MAG: dipeptidase [Gemmatimonadota bacterium]|nr:dipeptidase [Gemmatimonadota bacterium]MDH5758037.1 dipeptidase [Gemmatimonadota bacterium]
MPEKMNRRDFVRTASAAAVIPPTLASLGAATPRPTGHTPDGSRWPGYAGAVVIDCLASPGLFNVPVNPPLTPEMIRYAVESGITAVNVTVSGGDFESTMRRMSPRVADVHRYPEAFRQVRDVAGLLAAKEEGRLGLIFGFQDTMPIERDLSKLDVFHDLGVKIIQLTYNVRNFVGDGCLEPGNAGLSTFGRQVVERMDELGILVDLGHCGQRTTAEGIAASKNPVAITHSGCSAVEPHPRSKRDEELRAMADGGGVVGIYLMPFLTPGRVPTAADVLDHIEHAIQVCGEDHVGIGSDLSTTPIDGSDEYWKMHRTFVAGRIEAGIAAPNEHPDILFTVPELNSHRRMDLLADAMAARGHTSARIEKVLGGNFLRLFRDVWGAA